MFRFNDRKSTSGIGLREVFALLFCHYRSTCSASSCISSFLIDLDLVTLKCHPFSKLIYTAMTLLKIHSVRFELVFAKQTASETDFVLQRPLLDQNSPSRTWAMEEDSCILTSRRTLLALSSNR